MDIKPKFKYEIGTEDERGVTRIDHTSFPEAKESIDSIVDLIGEDVVGESTIIIRKKKI